MRFLHTACWQLGRRLHGRDRLEDQAHALDALVELAREVRPDAVVVAGDVLDGAVPAPDAVELAEDAFARLLRGLGVPVVALLGGDAAAPALPLGGRVLAEAGLHVVHAGSRADRPLELSDAHGSVLVHALPPRAAAEQARGDLDAARAAAGSRSVLVAHASLPAGAVVARAVPCWPASDLSAFRVALLGHDHSPGASADGRLVACGAPLALDLADADAERGVAVIEVDRAGRATVERVALPARREVRRLVGALADLVAAQDGVPCRDLVVLSLTDAMPRLGLLERARAAFPELLFVERALDAAAPPDLVEVVSAWALERGEAPLDEVERGVLAELLAPAAEAAAGGAS